MILIPEVKKCSLWVVIKLAVDAGVQAEMLFRDPVTLPADHSRRSITLAHADEDAVPYVGAWQADESDSPVLLAELGPRW